MRSLAGWVGALWLAAGCTVPSDAWWRCGSDADCGEGGLCDPELRLCYTAGTETEFDGGSCDPACAEYEACTRSGCKARFTRLTIQSPMDDALLDAGTVQVVALLEVNDTYKNTTRFPPMLKFTVEQPGGGGAGTLAFANASSDDAGTYRIPWTPPPAVEAAFILRAEHPDAYAGLNDSVNVTVDGVPPVFSVNVPPFDAGMPDGGTTYGDPDAGGFWPRDQQIPVEVRTDEANLDPGSIRVALRGTDGGTGTAVTVTPVTTGCDAGFCGVALMNLWEPPFDTFRGSMALDVQGQDRAGNPGTVSPPAPPVKVTRWKWAFSVPAGALNASPAVGNQGTVYLGSTDNTQGMVFALNPDGTKKWEAPVGAVASLAVGAFDGGVESVYVAANTWVNRAVLYALSSEDGGVSVRCPEGTNEHSGQVQSTMAITTVGSGPNLFETGMAIVNDGSSTQLYLVRPELSGTARCAQSTSSGFNFPETNPGGSLVANGNRVFYPTGAAASIVGYTLFRDALDWTATTGTDVLNGLALTGEALVGGGSGALASQGGLYRVVLPVTGTHTTAELLQGTEGGRVWSPIIGPGGTNAYFGQDTGTNQGALKTYELPGEMMASPAILEVGVLRYAPALGADGVLYTASSSSTAVTARAANDLSQRWTVTLPVASTASVALDCARSPSGAPESGKPGTLYVPAGGTLHAIIVDSPGLSQGTGAWPKYQHDARNTGNPSTPITHCP